MNIDNYLTFTGNPDTIDKIQKEVTQPFLQKLAGKKFVVGEFYSVYSEEGYFSIGFCSTGFWELLYKILAAKYPDATVYAVFFDAENHVVGCFEHGICWTKPVTVGLLRNVPKEIAEWYDLPEYYSMLPPEQRPWHAEVDFDAEEMVTIFEFAREAMQDADTFDRIAQKMDLSDEYACALRDKLQRHMGVLLSTTPR